MRKGWVVEPILLILQTFFLFSFPTFLTQFNAIYFLSDFESVIPFMGKNQEFSFSHPSTGSG
jgi:hypothetical protein